MKGQVHLDDVIFEDVLQNKEHVLLPNRTQTICNLRSTIHDCSLTAESPLTVNEFITRMYMATFIDFSNISCYTTVLGTWWLQYVK